MVVGGASACVVNVSAKNRVGIRIAVCGNLPTTVNKCVSGLCGNDRVHHNTKIAARGVLHSNRNADAACGQSVLLVLNRTCSNRNVGKKVRKVTVILGVQHFVSAGEIVVAQSCHMKLTDGNDALVHIRLFLGIGLMQHSLVALTRGSRLVRVNTGDDNDLICYLLLHSAKAGNVFKNRLAVISGARSDHEKKLIGATVKYSANSFVSCSFYLLHTLGEWIFFLNLLGNRKLSVEIHLHFYLPLFIIFDLK